MELRVHTVSISAESWMKSKIININLLGLFFCSINNHIYDQVTEDDSRVGRSTSQKKGAENRREFIMRVAKP